MHIRKVRIQPVMVCGTTEVMVSCIWATSTLMRLESSPTLPLGEEFHGHSYHALIYILPYIGDGSFALPLW